MAERIENGKRYFRVTVDCETHGAGQPAFKMPDFYEEWPECAWCVAENAFALIEAGGYEDWEWLPEHLPPLSPVARYWAEAAARDAELYSGRFFTPTEKPPEGG